MADQQDREDRREHERETQQHHTQIWKSIDEVRKSVQELTIKQTSMNVLQVQLDQAVSGLEIMSDHLQKHVEIDDAAHIELMNLSHAVKTMNAAEEARVKEAEGRRSSRPCFDGGPESPWIQQN